MLHSILLCCNPQAAKVGHLNRADTWFLCHPEWDQKMWSHVHIDFRIIIFLMFTKVAFIWAKYSNIVNNYYSMFLLFVTWVIRSAWKVPCLSQSCFITAPPLKLMSVLHLFAKYNEIHTFLFHWMIWSSLYRFMLFINLVFCENRWCLQVFVKKSFS